MRVRIKLQDVKYRERQLNELAIITDEKFAKLELA
jgi:hypothetical protein